MFVSGDEFPEIDATLFVGADITSLDNGVVFGVGLAWKNLDPSQKKINLQELQDRTEVLGYGDIYVVNETGQLLARRSRVGTGMLMLDAGGI